MVTEWFIVMANEIVDRKHEAHWIFNMCKSVNLILEKTSSVLVWTEVVDWLHAKWSKVKPFLYS